MATSLDEALFGEKEKEKIGLDEALFGEKPKKTWWEKPKWQEWLEEPAKRVYYGKEGEKLFEEPFPGERTYTGEYAISKIERPPGAKVKEFIEKEFIEEWPSWLSLAIGYGITGAIAYLPFSARVNSIISKASQKFAKNNLSTMQKNAPGVVKTQSDATAYTEMAVKSQLSTITRQAKGMTSKEILNLTHKIADKVSTYKLTPSEAMLALPTPTAPTGVNAVQKLIEVGLPSHPANTLVKLITMGKKVSPDMIYQVVKSAKEIEPGLEMSVTKQIQKILGVKGEIHPISLHPKAEGYGTTFGKTIKELEAEEEVAPTAEEIQREMMSPKTRPEAKEAAPTIKEPWQMTQKEYLSQITKQEEQKSMMLDYIEEGVKKNKSWEVLGKELEISANEVSRIYQESLGGGISEMEDVGIISSVEKHKAIVERAFLAGETIPPNVLADYPELKGVISEREIIPKEVEKDIYPEELEMEKEIPEKKEISVKPPIPPTPPIKGTPEFIEPEKDPVAKISKLIKQAEPLRKKLEKAYTVERGKRIAEVDKFITEQIDTVGGEEGYKAILGKLKGELAKPEAKIAFEPVKEKLTEEELKALYIRTWKHPYLDNWEKISAADGLTNLLMGGIPQPKKLVLLEEIYGSELIKNILSKRVWGAKATDFLVEVANVPRALLATADMSGFLRQGIIEVAAHPVISAKAMGKTFEFAFKPKTLEEYFKDLPQHRHYKLMRRFKIGITDPSKAGMQEREEAFISRFLQKVPILKVPILFAERAYVGFLNKLRVDIYSDWADELLSKGFTPNKNPKEFRAAADVVNTFTGRGSLGKLDRITPQLNTVFFSPRLIAARFQSLNPVWYIKQPKEIRKRAIGDFSKFVIAGLTTLAVAKLAAGDKVDVEIDPRSSDFGKIRIGNTRFDIWGGHQQFARCFTQIIMGQRKSTTTGEIISLNKDEYPFTTRKEVLLRFIEGKLAPVPALVNELMAGAKTWTGEDMTLKSVTFEKFVPMYIQDIADAYTDGSLERAVGVALPAFFGVGVQTWQSRKKKGKYWWEGLE